MIYHIGIQNLYIYENFPSAWGIGEGSEKFVVEKKLNIDPFKLFINDKLDKRSKGKYEKVIEGLYRYKFTYPYKKAINKRL